MAKHQFQPGQSGNPSGRPKRSHSRKELLDLLAERFGKDFDPVVKLAEIAEADGTSLELRVRCYSEIAPYLHSRRRAIEASVQGTTLEQLVVASFAAEPNLRSTQAATAPGSTPPLQSPKHTDHTPAMPSAEQAGA